MPLVDEYKKMSDEQLVLLYKEGKTQAADILVEKYKNLVRKKARTFFLTGADNEDLIQEGMIGLYKAIRDYEPEKDVVFMSFASICINRQISTAITNYNRKKNLPLNSAISLDSPIDDMDDDVRLGDIITNEDDGNPETAFINKEQGSILMNSVFSKLSKMEVKVLELYLEGLSYVEIAKALGKNEKSIDNAIQRIRNKLDKK